MQNCRTVTHYASSFLTDKTDQPFSRVGPWHEPTQSSFFYQCFFPNLVKWWWGRRKRVDSTKEEGERNGTHERKIDNVKIEKGSNKPWIRGGPSKVPVYRGGPKLQHGILVKRGRSGCIVPGVGHLATNNGYLPCGLRKDASRHGIRAWKALSNPMECWRWREFHLLAHSSVQIVFDPSNAGWLEVELPSGQTYWPN